MAGEFFARFNLHNSVASFPVKADLFAKLLDLPEEELQRHIDEFEEVQARRAEKLKNKYGDKIDLIRGKKTVFFGDSISSDNLGYRIAVTQAAELNAVNRTVSGATSAVLLQDSWEILEKNRPEIVSLMMGANDSPMQGDERLSQVSLTEYERNVSALVRWSKNLGAKVLLFEVTPVNEERFAAAFTKQKKYQTNKNIEQYNAVLRGIAEKYDIELFSNQWILEDIDRYFEPDGIHLSVDGQDIFADKWLSATLK